MKTYTQALAAAILNGRKVQSKLVPEFKTGKCKTCSRVLPMCLLEKGLCVDCIEEQIEKM